jgi:hypothetical protein
LVRHKPGDALLKLRFVQTRFQPDWFESPIVLFPNTEDERPAA